MLSFKLFRSLNHYIRKSPIHSPSRKKNSCEAQTVDINIPSFFYELPEMYNAGNGVITAIYYTLENPI